MATLTNNGIMQVDGTISGNLVNNGTIYKSSTATLPTDAGGTVIEVASTPDYSKLIVEGGRENTDYTYESNVLTVKTNTPLRITAPIKNTTDKIVIDSNCTAANVTLNNMNIDLSGTDNACAFEVQGSASCTLTLVGVSTFKKWQKQGRCPGGNRCGYHDYLR